MSKLPRREFIKNSVTLASIAGLGATTSGCATLKGGDERSAATSDWWSGDVVHLLPMVNHDRMLIKTSFRAPRRHAPSLLVNGRKIEGLPLGSSARFWQFDASGLASDTSYELQLIDGDRSALCDPWPLKTFPHPDAEVESLKVLIYTCAGGDENRGSAQGLPEAVPKALRQRFFQRALGMNPDAVIAVGDQVYIDRETGVNDKIYGPGARDRFDELGWFDPSLPVLGSANETALIAHVDEQISKLYGVMFRSVPTYLTQDDHDFFENDEANDKRITFPANSFNLNLGRATQHLYFPEFLPDDNRPLGLSGSSAADRAQGLSESFGTLRYGKLAELLMYDCRKFMDLKALHARFVPEDAEQWLLSRTAAQDTHQLIHIPSTPMGWSAGKWGEWYPDVRQGKLLTDQLQKPHWQTGWFEQHQRIIGALTGNSSRPALMVSGDLHAIGYGVIRQSGAQDLTANPVHSILSGPLGTEQEGFPSYYRGIGAQVPSALAVDEVTPPLEKLGFTMLDIRADEVIVEQYAWWRPEEETAIDSLQPFARYRIARASR